MNPTDRLVLRHQLRALAMLAALIGALALVGSVFGAEPDPWAPCRAVVQLNVKSGRQAWQGSATLIGTAGDTGLLLSCRHVCERTGMLLDVNWLGLGGVKTKGLVIYVERGRDFNTDLALVQVVLPAGAKPVAVAQFDAAAGPWTSAGYRSGRFYTNTATTAKTEGNMLIVNSPFIQGMSGGCLFDRYGRVVGVVVGSDFKQTGIVCDGAAMRDMIAKYRKQ